MKLQLVDWESMAESKGQRKIWKKDHRFPKPLLRYRGRELWDVEEVRLWLEREKGWPARADKDVRIRDLRNLLEGCTWELQRLRDIVAKNGDAVESTDKILLRAYREFV